MSGDGDGGPTIAEVIERLDAEPPGKVFRSPPPADARISEFEQAHGRLPDDVRILYGWSDGVGVARSPVGFYLPPLAGLARLAEDTYADAFPGMLLLGDDGASGLFVLDRQGSAGQGDGVVLLTDRGSLRPEDTVVAGPSVAAVIAAVLHGADLWQHRRLS